jgi:hypothetical protein
MIFATFLPVCDDDLVEEKKASISVFVCPSPSSKQWAYIQYALYVSEGILVLSSSFLINIW